MIQSRLNRYRSAGLLFPTIGARPGQRSVTTGHHFSTPNLFQPSAVLFGIPPLQFVDWFADPYKFGNRLGIAGDEDFVFELQRCRDFCPVLPTQIRYGNCFHEFV
jgi:hypothetical protein